MKTIFIGFRFLILLCFGVYISIVQNPDEIFSANNRDKLVNGSTLPERPTDSCQENQMTLK